MGITKFYKSLPTGYVPTGYTIISSDLISTFSITSEELSKITYFHHYVKGVYVYLLPNLPGNRVKITTPTLMMHNTWKSNSWCGLSISRDVAPCGSLVGEMNLPNLLSTLEMVHFSAQLDESELIKTLRSRLDNDSTDGYLKD